MIKRSKITFLLVAILFSSAYCTNISKDSLLDFVNTRYQAYFHYNMCTFKNYNSGTHSGRSTGTEPASMWAPTGLDTDQWAQTVIDAKMEGGWLTTKHHGGFCLWDSAYTDYDVASSSVPTDVVAAFVKSFRARNLKVGLYYSILDYHHGIENGSITREEIDFMKNQITELLTNYGPIDYLNFDGWSTWSSTPDFDDIWYGEIREHVKSLQPDCLIISHTYESNLAHADVPFADAAGRDYPYHPDYMRPTAASDFLAIDWWWDDDNYSVTKSVSYILGKLDSYNSHNSVYILNISPNINGKLEQAAINRLKEAAAAWDRPTDIPNYEANWGYMYDVDTNLAFQKPSTQSSTHSYIRDKRAYPRAEIAVDGVTEGNLEMEQTSYTNQDAQAWWQVDLLEMATINNSTIYNRTDANSERLSDYTVSILDMDGNTVWSDYQTDYPASSISIDTDGAMGQFVKVQLNGTNYLHLAEVIVEGDMFISPKELTAVSVDQNQIDLSWQDNTSDEDSFILYRKSENADWEQIAQLEVDTTSYSDTNIESGILYQYRVCAAVGVMSSAYSNEAEARTKFTLQNFADLAGCWQSQRHMITQTATEETVNGNPHNGPSIIALQGDLLETSLASYTLSDALVPSRSAPEMAYDGIIGTETNYSAGSYSLSGLMMGTGNWVEYTLDTTTNNLGYEITDVSTIGSWLDRTGQAYTLKYSSVDNPESFVTIATVEPVVFANNSVSRVTIATNDGKSLASNVVKVRFEFNNADISWNAYREIDITGTPSTITGVGNNILIDKAANNGSFEETDGTSSNTDSPNWILSSNGWAKFVQDAYIANAPSDGQWAVAVNNNVIATILSDNVQAELLADLTINVTFDIGNNGNGLSAPSVDVTVFIILDGTETELGTQTFTADAVGQLSWEQYSVSYKIINTSSELQLKVKIDNTDSGPDNDQVYLDNVMLYVSPVNAEELWPCEAVDYTQDYIINFDDLEYMAINWLFL